MIVVDDLLDQSMIDTIENHFRFGEVDWRLVDYSSGPSSNEFEHSNAEDTAQFVHMAYHTEMGILNQLSMSYVLEILQGLEKRFSIKIDECHRFKINCTLKRSDFSNKYNPSHKDMHEEGWLSCVYYINDSDGPTYFFDNNGNITDKVNPKKGRCVIFKSDINHAGTCPVNNKYRLVTNIIAKPNRTDFL